MSATVWKNTHAKAGKSFTCPNPLCGRTFPVPIKLMDLRVKGTEPYLACLYCLKRISPYMTSQAREPVLSAPEGADSRQETVSVFEHHVEEPVVKCACHLGLSG